MPAIELSCQTGSVAPIGRAADRRGRRQELAGFLRSRRERIAPEQVGLPPASRRRTPGLRREEVATLAGVGVTWYTWLEQGRDINASPQVLDAVARTLLLDPHERDHLFRLADAPDSTGQSECKTLPPTAQLLLDQLEPFPACIRNARYDVLAFNQAYEELLGPLSDLPFEERNSLWRMFTNPGCRTSPGSTGRKARAGWWPSTAPPWPSTSPSRLEVPGLAADRRPRRSSPSCGSGTRSPARRT